jgi:hypothetical protein
MFSHDVTKVPFYKYSHLLESPEKRKTIFSNVELAGYTLAMLKLGKSEVEEKSAKACRFAIYSHISLDNGTTYCWMNPSLPSFASDEQEKAKKEHYNPASLDLVVKSDPVLTGVVHQKIKAIIAVADLKNAPLIKKSDYSFIEVGSSGYLEKQDDGSFVILMTYRSTMNYSVHFLNDLPEICFFFNPQTYVYDQDTGTLTKKNKQPIRNYTNLFHLERTLAKEECSYINEGIQNYLNKMELTEFKIIYPEEENLAKNQLNNGKIDLNLK